MQVFFILFSVYFAIYQYINSKCLYRTHVNYDVFKFRVSGFIAVHLKPKT